MELGPSLPLHRHLRLRFRRSIDSASSSSLQLCTHKGRVIGRFLYKQAIPRHSTNYALNGCPYVPRKNEGGKFHYYLQEFKQQYFGYALHSWSKSSNRTVARSEQFRNGFTDAAYPLSDVKLESKVRGICFYAVAVMAGIFLFGPMLMQHPFVLLLDRYQRKAHHFLIKIWATLTVSPFLTIEFEGLENLPSEDAPAVYVSNHQSFLDVYTLLTLGKSFKFISKTGIFLVPIVGWSMCMMGIIPLKRMDSRSRLECLKRCMDVVKKGGCVFVFPEGTRSKDGKLGAFKKGAFSIAAKTGVPVIPITLVGTGKIMPAGMEGILNAGSIHVFIHEPIKGTDPEVLRDEARNIIADTLEHQR